MENCGAATAAPAPVGTANLRPDVPFQGAVAAGITYLIGILFHHITG